MVKVTFAYANTTASMKRTMTKRYNERSWQAGRHTPNTMISSKQPRHLSEETGVQLMQLDIIFYGTDTFDAHENKYRTNMRPHIPKWK